MEQNPEGETRLPEVWQRLETICRRLWDADSPVALDLQVVIEEFKGETHRAEQSISTLRKLHNELRETLTKDMQQASADEIRSLKFELKTVRDHAAALEADVVQKEKRNQELLKELAEKEAVNLEFHERFLASAAEQDEARAKKMESFYQDLQKKEADIEAGWEARRAELETGYKQRNEALKKRHEELLEEMQSRAAALEEHYAKKAREIELTQERFRTEREGWETFRLAEQQVLSKRKEELALHTENLASEYKKKQGELQRIKEAMQAELAEVVRQYQAKMRGPGA
jgi:chromosome segregation ATPase